MRRGSDFARMVAMAMGIAMGFATWAASPGEQRKADSAGDGEWTILGRTSDAQHSSPLRQINEKSISKLGLGWYADIPSKDGLVGNPLVSEGIVFQGGPGGNIYANDLRTGKQLWQYQASPVFEGSSLATFWSARHNRGVALEGDNVIIAVADCRLVAVNKKSGKLAWQSTSCDRTGTYGITAAPRVGGGMVFTGNNCIDSGAERGFVEAFDAKTGAKRWRFYTMPNDPAKGQENKILEMAEKTWGTGWHDKTHGCASAWDSLTYDPKLNLLYIGTGGPAPFNPLERALDAGDELFSNSIVAVKADTGEYVWHYKVNPHDGWNFDATMPMMVAELPVQGVKRRVVMSAPKDGFFYVLDAATGKFISANNFTPVNWAKGIDQKTGRPIILHDANYWERPAEPTVASPGPYGAHSWQAMAYNQQTGLVYIPVIVAPTLIENDPKAKVGGISFDMYYGSSGRDPKWVSYGELVAWDPVAQKARWRVRQKLPINGGTLTTAGNLVFQGTADGHFNAYAADSGKLAWTFNVGASVQAAPSTVEVDGQQVLLVASGNASSATTGMYMARYGSAANTRGVSRLLEFKLGGTAVLPAPPAVREFDKPPRPRPPAELVSIGENRYEASFCVDCHGLKGESAGGTVPDLRHANAQTHDDFMGIVLGGLRKEKGMPMFADLSMEDAQAIQAYLIEQSWQAFDAQALSKSKAAAAAAAK